MHVPFINLKLQYESIKVEMDRALAEALTSFQFLKGPQVQQFEHNFAKMLGAKECISTASGTDSIFVILKALGIGSGDEVITPALSWISSSETITLAGATPVFADVDPVYYTMDPKDIESRITGRTRAIIIVHLYGQSCDIEAIATICKKNNLLLIEDCAQSHFTAFDDKYTGTFGIANAFSFYPTKNLGAYGDAGCVTTDDKDLAERMRRFCNHGALSKDDHEFEGTNSRMDTIQAAVLNAKLPYVLAWNQQRRALANRYSQELTTVSDIATPITLSNTLHSFHIYAIRTSRRDELRNFLEQNGIQCLVHYPTALPNLDCYKNISRRTSYPVATALQNELLSLPLYPELEENQIKYICQKIKEFYGK